MPKSLLLPDIVQLIQVLLGVFGFGWSDIIGPFTKWRSTPGIYDVLEHQVTLELKDTRGKRAVYTKYQKVRFTQDNVIAYQDTAWGAGNIFADYKCSPGVAVDHYKEGHRYRVLISLRKTKNKGDIEHIHINRRVEDGFTKRDESFQTEVDHRMHKLAISVVFPKKRLPKTIELIEQNTNRTVSLDYRHFHTLSDGRYQVSWETKNPRLYEAYILAWRW